MFGDLLRQLLDLCDVKMYVLAQELGYDKSYLSKWINNTKLPSEKNIDETIARIAEVLVRLSSADTKYALANSYGVSVRRLEKKITLILKESYWETQNSYFRREQEKRSDDGLRQIVTGRSRCILRFLPGDSYGRWIVGEIKNADRLGKPLHLDVLIDPQQYSAKPMDSFRELIWLPGVQLSGGVTLLEQSAPFKAAPPDRLLIEKGRRVYISLTDPFSGQIYYPLSTDEPTVVDSAYRSAKQYLTSCKPLAGYDEYWEQEYSKSIIYKRKRYLLSDMHTIYMKPDLLGEVVELVDRTGRPDPRQTLYDGFMKEYEVEKDVIIFESAIAEYLNTGHLYLSSSEATLSRPQVIRHLQGIIEAAEQRNTIRLRILRDRNPALPYSADNVSLFTTLSTVYCSKNCHIQYIVSPECIDLLNNGLDLLHGLDSKYLLTPQESLNYLRSAIGYHK